MYMMKGILCFPKSFLVLAFLAIGLGMQAQKVNISGNVYESDAETPIEGATFVVEGTTNGGYTDGSGFYTLKVDRKDEVRVLFRYFGQNDTVLVVEIPAGQNAVTVDLVWGGGITMGTQVITSGRHKQDLEDVVSSMDVINPDKVDLQATNDIEDALQQGSGVDIIDGQPNIRGSSGYAYGVGSRVMVMLDGLPLLSPDAAFAQFDLIPTDNIAQIEIMKGASSVLYGSSALGGVINVLTADAPSEPKTSIRVRGQVWDQPKDVTLDWDPESAPTAGAINVFHSRKVGNHDITVLGDYWKESGWREDTRSQQGRLMGMTKFRPKAVPGLTLGVNGSYRFDSSSTFLFWDSYLPTDSLLTFSNALGSGATYPSNGAYSGATSRRRQFNDRFTVDPFIKFLTKKNDVHMLRGRYMQTNNNNDTGQGSRNKLLYTDYQFTTQFLDERITLVSGATAIFGWANGDSLYQGSHFSQNYAGYSQMDAAVTEKLNVTFGGRFDYININDTITVSSPVFRAGANYEIVKGTNVRASFGQAFRSPSIAERFTFTNASGLVIVPNPQIEVEKGWSAEVGVRQGIKFGDDKRFLLGFVDVAGFMMDFNNMVEFGVRPPQTFTFSAPVFQARNVAAARITGIEATTFLEWGRDDFYLSVSGGVTYIDPVNKNGLTDSTELVDLLGYIGSQANPVNDSVVGQFLAYNLPEDNANRLVDNPRFLKYRSNWTNRFSATVGYGRYAFTCNYRYKSQIRNIDQFLFVAIPGSADFVRTHPGGITTIDFILGVDVIEGLKLSFNAENVFNEEYVILPGIIGEPRNFSMQVKYVF